MHILSASGPIRKSVWIWVAILCAAWIPFSISLAADRIGDDRDLIVARLDPGRVLSAAQLWQENYWGGFAASGLYRPIPLTALYFERLAFGLTPWPYHVINLLLYALCGALCFLYLRTLVSPAASLLATLLFLLHPAHVEAVVTGYGQAEILAAGFVFTALLLHARGRIPLAAAAFLCALLCKEVAVSFPVLVIATRGLWATPSLPGWRRWLAPSDAWYAAALALYAVLKFLAIGTLTVPPTGTPLSLLPYSQRLFQILGVGLGNYMRLLLFPFSQSMLYDAFPHPYRDSLWVLAAVVLALAAVRLLGTRPVLYAAIWFLSTWFVFSNLVVPTGVHVAERLLFLPLVAVCLPFGLLWERTSARWALLLVLALAAAQSAHTSWQWRTEELSLRAALAEHPESPKAHANLGLALLITPQYEHRPITPEESAEAEQILSAAVQNFPNLPEAHRGLGVVYLLRGDFATAAAHLRRGLALRPADPIIASDLAYCERRLAAPAP